jgi:hypothetical protein
VIAPAAPDASAEHARRLHALGVVAVVTLWLPIFFWMVHLGSLAALAPYLDNNPDKWWLWWVDTGLLAAGTIACILISIAIGLRMRDPSDVGTPEGRTRFLAWQGVLAGLANLALILAEGSTITFFLGHR